MVDARWFPLARAVAGARCRLVCLPYAGGGASAFREWPDLLPGVEVLAVQWPGREHRVHEPPRRELKVLVEELLAVVQALPGELPLALFGHSLGALLAFVLARRLCAEGRPPRWLFAAGARAPHRPARRILHDLPLQALLAEMVRLGGTSPRVLAEKEIVAMVEPALRADLFLAETNVVPAVPKLPVPITVFGGAEDPHVAVGDLQAWREVAGAGCAIEFLPGGHFFLRDARAELLARVKAVLAVGQG